MAVAKRKRFGVDVSKISKILRGISYLPIFGKMFLSKLDWTCTTHLEYQKCWENDPLELAPILLRPFIFVRVLVDYSHSVLVTTT